jgi:ABC-type Zn uptake system ZnuABC Zn-binding protein ZnuA
LGLGEACGEGEGDAATADVLVTTTYLEDIVGRVAGDRLTVLPLFPRGADPHSFQPTPGTARLIADSRIVVLDVFGLEPAVDELIESSRGEENATIEAAAGLPVRVAAEGPGPGSEGDSGSEESDAHSDEGEIDPHFWLDPVNVVGYVENIKAGLSAVDPEEEATYEANAEAYIAELEALDEWIRGQVEALPPGKRLLVTNHESLGYFADRYGFQIVGSVFGAGGPEGAPSAQQLATLVEAISETGAPAIFVETGSSPELAEQVANETGVAVISDLHTHSVSDEAPTYIDMMRWNVTRIVEALR